MHTLASCGGEAALALASAAAVCHSRQLCLIPAVVDIVQVAIAAQRADIEYYLRAQTFRCAADAASNGASIGRLADLRAPAAGGHIAHTRQTLLLLCARLPVS